MEQEAADELDCVKGHDADAVVVSGIAPAKAYLAVFEGEEPSVGDGDAVGVASQILQHLLGPAEGWFGVHDPLVVAQEVEQ